MGQLAPGLCVLSAAGHPRGPQSLEPQPEPLPTWPGRDGVLTLPLPPTVASGARWACSGWVGSCGQQLVPSCRRWQLSAPLSSLVGPLTPASGHSTPCGGRAWGWQPRLPCTSGCSAHPRPHSILLSLGWGRNLLSRLQTGVGEGTLLTTRAPAHPPSPSPLPPPLPITPLFWVQGLSSPRCRRLTAWLGSADPRVCPQDHGASAQVSGSLPGQYGRRGRGLGEGAASCRRTGRPRPRAQVHSESLAPQEPRDSAGRQ